MYDTFNPGYECMYNEETEVDNSIYYDDYTVDTVMHMTQPRSPQSAIHYKPNNYQNYMGYPSNQIPLAVPNSYNPKPVMYPQQQRPIHSSIDTYSNQSTVNLHRQPPMGQYIPPHQPSTEYIPKQVHQKMIKRYENTLKLIRHKNIAMIEKLRILSKKIIMQEKMVRQFLLTGQTIQNIEGFEAHDLQSIKSSINEPQQQYILTEYKQSDQFSNYKQNFTQIETVSRNSDLNENLQERKQLPHNLVSKKQILADKIKRLAERAHEKVKIQNIEKVNATVQNVQAQKNIQNKKSLVSIPDTFQKQKNFQDQDNLDPDQPMYPDDNDGQQSFLVTQDVQEKQRAKKLKSHPKSHTFGISNPDVEDYSYRSPTKNPLLQRQVQIIQRFLDTFLGGRIDYAPFKEFSRYRINKVELYQIYVWWREKNNVQPALNLNKKAVQSKITAEIHRRFPSILDDRQQFVGLMFKDNEILKMMKTSQIVL